MTAFGITSVQKASKKKKKSKETNRETIMAINFVPPARVLPFCVLSSPYFFISFLIVRVLEFEWSRMWVNFPPFLVLGLGWFHSTIPPFHRSTIPPFHHSTNRPLHSLRDLFWKDILSCLHRNFLRVGRVGREWQCRFDWVSVGGDITGRTSKARTKTWTWSCSYSRVRILVFKSTVFFLL